MEHLDDLVARVKSSGEGYLETLRAPSMSAGVYVIPAGGEDHQSPHEQDEIYFVVRGRAKFRHRELDRPVGPGDLLFVPARDPHRFHSVDLELVLLVVFAPPYSGPPAKT